MPDLMQIGIHLSKPAFGCAQKAPPRTRVFWLQGVTLVWMVIEFGVSAYAAITAHSPAMLAFGSDSLVELMSASVVLLQWVPSMSISERKATRTASMLLFVLAFVVAGTALASLVLGLRPGTSRAGIGITMAALVAMPVLAWLKRREAHHSGNKALAADAAQSATCAYGHAADTGFMLFVDAKSSIHGPDDLGIHISSDPKAAKRVRRFFSAHSLMLKGRVIDRAKSPLGMQYAVQMEDGRLLSVLDFDKSVLDERQCALKEGSCICRIPGFDGTTATFGGPWGQGKGIAHDNPQVWMYDLVIYDSKKEVVFTGKDHSVYFGVLSRTGLHPFRMDLQTMTNTGLYEESLAVKAGLNRTDELAELYSGDDEDAIIADFAATVKAVDSVTDTDSYGLHWSQGGFCYRQGGIQFRSYDRLAADEEGR